MGAPSAQVQSPQGSSGKGTAGINSNKNSDIQTGLVRPQEMSSGKGSSQYGTLEQMQGSQGKVTMPGQGGQPEMGMPNAYSNTIQNGQNLLDSQGSWDNSPKAMGKGSAGSSGKGKGA